ncbi:MAG: DMT family transporter [Methylocella sp.]
MTSQLLIWTMLIAGVMSDVAGATSMKFSDGFSRLWPSLLVFVFYAAAFELQAQVLRPMDLGLTYAIWAGAGTILTALVGVMLFRESMPLLKIVFLIVIIIGIVGVRLTGSGNV